MCPSECSEHWCDAGTSKGTQHSHCGAGLVPFHRVTAGSKTYRQALKTPLPHTAGAVAPRSWAPTRGSAGAPLSPCGRAQTHTWLPLSLPSPTTHSMALVQGMSQHFLTLRYMATTGSLFWLEVRFLKPQEAGRMIKAVSPLVSAWFWH